MLQNWLTPVPDTIKRSDSGHPSYEFGEEIAVFRRKFPKLTRTQIALIGIGDQQANAVRSALYTLSFPFKRLFVADLGNIRNNKTANLIPIVKELIDSNIFPVLIGDNENLLLSQFKAHKTYQKLVNLAIIDEKLRLDPTEKPTSKHYPFNELLRLKHPTLFHLDLIGCQAHYLSETINTLTTGSTFDFCRLGQLRHNLEITEPLIRDADLLGFNLAALKQSEAPGQLSPTPSGLFSEEACQLCRYAGMSDKLRSFGIYGHHPSNDTNHQTAQLIAQMIWYFIEGFCNRKGDYPVSSHDLVEYLVQTKQLQQPFTFWKSRKSGRWWIQVPVKTRKKHQRHYLIPCSYSDYKLTCQEEIPERLLNAFKRF